MRSTTRRLSICTNKPYAVQTRKPMPIIVEIEGDVLAFRHKGQRRRFRLDIQAAMKEAIIRDA